jgi:hypothetical membrane protein
LIGLLAVAWFWSLLAAFGALRSDGYSHLTKAVSELGSQGAPNMAAWNLLGFGVTGLLLAVFGWRLGREARPDTPFTAACLCASGLAFAATAIPADMENLRSPGSAAHIGASMLVFAAWLPGVWGLTGRRRSWRALATVSTAALWASLAAILVRGSGLLLPGLGQRLSFAVYFGWVLAAALVVWARQADARAEVDHPSP